jgi:hypothetical protein
MRSQQHRPPNRRSASPAVVHSPLAADLSASFALDDHYYQPSENKQRSAARLPREERTQQQRSSSSREPSRRRRRPEPEPELRDAATSTSPPRQPAEYQPAAAGHSRLASCASRALVAILLLALAVVSLSCVALLAALMSTSQLPDMPNFFDDANPLSVDPPCMHHTWFPPEELMALPAPVSCHFSFLRFRCAPAQHCLTSVRLFPLPHAKCSMRPWHVSSEMA